MFINSRRHGVDKKRNYMWKCFKYVFEQWRNTEEKERKALLYTYFILVRVIFNPFRNAIPHFYYVCKTTKNGWNTSLFMHIWVDTHTYIGVGTRLSCDANNVLIRMYFVIGEKAAAATVFIRHFSYMLILFLRLNMYIWSCF